jgi:osmotically-inducible protein OsmY
MFTLTAGLILMTGTVRAEPDSAIYLAADSALENTERNVRDQNDATLTPEDQKENESDIKITADIRQALVRDKSLSVNAQNVKIITRDGKVTLRGPVESKAESLRLQQITKQTPGVVQVDNQLEHKAP